MMQLRPPPQRHLDADREFPRDLQPNRNAIRRGLSRVHGAMVAMPGDVSLLMEAACSHKKELNALLNAVLYREPISDEDIPGYIREVLQSWVSEEEVA